MTKEIIIIVLVLVWSIPWKGFALWKSARKGDSVWFIILLLINTLAIIEILYIFIFSERKGKLKNFR
jgi:methionyl-tRNA synthetase